MNPRKMFFKLAVNLIVKIPAQWQSFDQWAAALEKSGRAFTAQLAKAADNPANTARLRHIIGIERWGQNRLRHFLQATSTPMELDEYDAYQPAAILNWAALNGEFTLTRQQTVNLAKQLAATPPTPADRTVRHNGLGQFSARAWLRYLDIHATFESKLMK